MTIRDMVRSSVVFRFLVDGPAEVSDSSLTALVPVIIKLENFSLSLAHSFRFSSWLDCSSVVRSTMADFTWSLSETFCSRCVLGRVGMVVRAKEASDSGSEDE